jgi:hypothetical protein
MELLNPFFKRIALGHRDNVHAVSPLGPPLGEQSIGRWPKLGIKVMIRAKHDKKINIIRVGDRCNKTPVENDRLRHTFCAEITHELSQSCKQANAPIGLLKSPEPLFNFVELRTMHPIREEPFSAERRNGHSAMSVAAIRADTAGPSSTLAVLRSLALHRFLTLRRA